MSRPTSTLAAEWRKRLADSGFDDHEDASGRLRTVGPQRGVNAAGEGNGHYLQADSYYDLLLAAMASPQFVFRWSPRQRRVIEMHVAGDSFRKIRLRMRCGHGWDLETVKAFRKEAGVTR